MVETLRQRCGSSEYIGLSEWGSCGGARFRIDSSTRTVPDHVLADCAGIDSATFMSIYPISRACWLFMATSCICGGSSFCPDVSAMTNTNALDTLIRT